MAASSSSAAPSQGNLRSRTVNWHIPGPQIDAPHISDEFNPPIEDRRLLSLARNLANVESDMVRTVQLIYTRVKDAKPNLSAQEVVIIGNSLAEIENITRQFTDIREGRHRLGIAYLKERRLLLYWQKYYGLVSQLLNDGFPGDQDDYLSTISAVKLHQKLLIKLPDAIVEAAAHGCLDDEQELLFGERWVKVDEMTEAYRSKVPELAELPNWEGVSARIAKARGRKEQEKPHTVLQSQSAILWLVFLNTVSNTSTFGLAYYYSSHAPGTTHDADFWFLVQQAMTQIVSLFVICIPLRTKVDLPRLPWLLPAIAVFVLTIASIPLYLYAPTEWSSFFMLVGGAIQTFLTLQLAVFSA